MANTALTNKVALASTGDKLKHWTQAIRDLYAELLELKSGVVPMYHASPTRQYGIGDTFKYGHLRLLDKLLYQFKQNADGTWWTKSDLPIIQGVRWNAVTWHAGLFIAVGSNGRIAKSKDGKTWDEITWIESTTTTKDFELFDVQWCGSMFVAAGSFNSLVYSFDGAYWYTPMMLLEPLPMPTMPTSHRGQQSSRQRMHGKELHMTTEQEQYSCVALSAGH